MLILTETARARSDSSFPVSPSRPQTKGATTNQGSSTASTGSDRLDISRNHPQVRQPNPYEGTAPDYIKVKVGKWGTGENDSLIGILRSQNYSKNEIYGKSEGKSLLDQVSQANNLRNPNLIREGQELLIPLKAKAETGETPQVETPTPVKVETQQETEQPQSQPQIHDVTVGKWGRDKNGSLYGILNSQGFSREQILKEDSNGDSLLKQVARANGLEDPNKIQEGAKLRVPGSMEALQQMDVPSLNPPQQREVQTPLKIEPRPIELAKPEIQIPEVKPIEQPKVEESTPISDADRSRVTANMGLLLDGVKSGNFKKDEFQYLNALSNRYEETRAVYSKDGFSNDELKSLGTFETRYGVTYTRLYNSDDITLSNQTSSSTSSAGRLRVRHYQEGGDLWEGYKNGSIDSEKAIETMIRQRTEARHQGGH